MDMYEISASVVIFVLFVAVYFLNRKRHELKMKIYRMETELKRKQ